MKAVGFSSETREAMFKVLQRSTVNPVKIDVRNKIEIKTLSERRKLREFITSRLTVKELLKELN